MIARKLGPAAVGALAAALVGACEGEPDLLCDSVRVVWPYFELDPSSDVSAEPGLQIDLVLRTGFLPGTTVALTVEGEEEEEAVFTGSVVAEDDGTLRYLAVDVREGPVTFILDAANDCGEYRTARSAFVWDGQGFPACSMDLADADPVMRAAFVDPVLDADADADGDMPGFQGAFEVAAGRPDMEVTLFVLDLATGVESSQSMTTGDDLVARFDVDLPEGSAAIRAVCLWPPRDRRISSTTRRFAVDTEAPSCALTEPSAAVTPGDDLDGDADNGIQFELRGSTTGADVDPASARFFVGDDEIAGSSLDAGESSAEASFPGPVPAEQHFAFELRDLAGNLCRDERSY